MTGSAGQAIMSTGIIGLERYLTYFFPGLSYWPVHLIGEHAH